MKKKTISVIVLFLLLFGGIVIASELGLLNRENTVIELSKADKEVIDSLGSGEIKQSELTCTEDSCTQRVWKENFNLGSIRIPARHCTKYEPENLTGNGEITCVEWTPYTSKELEAHAKEAVKKRLELVAGVMRERRARVQAQKKLGAGVITVREERA